jgi:hypothetical protein
MKPIGPDPSDATEDPVDGPRDADGEALHTAGEGALIAIGLHDEMNMVKLHREMEDTKAAARCGAQSRAHCIEDTGAAQRRKSGPCPQRDVHGVPRLMDRTTAVWNGAAARGRWTPRTFASATPRAGSELKLRTLPHFDSGREYSKLARLSSTYGRVAASPSGRRRPSDGHHEQDSGAAARDVHVWARGIARWPTASGRIGSARPRQRASTAPRIN